MENGKNEIMRDFDNFDLKGAAFQFLAMFSGWMVFACVMDYAMGNLDAKTLRAILGLMGLCSFPFLQLAWFGPRLIRRAAWGLRVAGFGASYLPVVMLSVYLAGGMDGAPAGAWATFAVIYLAILAAFSAYFQRRYRRLAGSYQAALDRYHAEREAEAEKSGNGGKD